MRIIISGGGTGGHVYPAIAIADALKKINSEIDILFVGANGKLEMGKVPKAGYPIEGLWISGFHRKLTVRNLLFPFKLMGSLAKAWQIVSRFKPDAVVGVGGYASGPVLEVASRKGIPSLIQEQNSFAGVTNRLLAKKVSRICVAYDGMERYFPKDKILLTGNPVRQDILDTSLTREEALQHFGMEASKKTLFVFGGSLGAKTINEAMAAGTDILKANENVQVLWQMGSLYKEEFEKSDTALLPNVHAKMFIDRMDLAYKMADVVISRAGALTISELCLVGKPAVLVPSPNVAEDHQTKNALALTGKDAAISVKDIEAKGKMLQIAFNLLDDPDHCRRKAENIMALGKPQAAETIAKEVIKLTETN